MATAKTVYVASDGSQWDSENRAIERDNLDLAVQAIEAMFPAPPSSSDERVAVDPAVMAEAKRLVVELCRAAYPSEPVFQHEPSEIHVQSYAGRFLSDVGGPLGRVWWKLSVYRDGFLYSQPFYVINPHQFTGVTR